MQLELLVDDLALIETSDLKENYLQMVPDDNVETVRSNFDMISVHIDSSQQFTLPGSGGLHIPMNAQDWVFLSSRANIDILHIGFDAIDESLSQKEQDEKTNIALHEYLQGETPKWSLFKFGKIVKRRQVDEIATKIREGQSGVSHAVAP